MNDEVTLSYDSDAKQLVLSSVPAFTESCPSLSKRIRIRYKTTDNTQIEYELFKNDTCKTPLNLLSVNSARAKEGCVMTFKQFILEGRKTAKAAKSIDFIYYQYYDAKNIGNCKITLDENAKTITLPVEQ